MHRECTRRPSRRIPGRMLWRGVMFGALVACSDSPVEPRAPMGTILYWVLVRGKSDVVAFDRGGTAPRPLTTSGSAFEPKWSWDGRWIVYLDIAVAPSGQKLAQVFLMHADGSGARQVTNDTSVVETPTISPDARRVAYACAARVSAPRFRICETAVDGGNQRLLTPTVLGYGPTWSPDGSLIAFACEVEGAPVDQVCTMSPDGTGLRAISPDSINVSSVTWSPDGSQFAVSAAPAGSTTLTLYIMSADGQQVRRVFDEPSPPTIRDTPTWSADQTQLAFVRYTQEGSKIYLVSVNGTNERPLVADTTLQWDPSWSPTRAR